ncbi:stomatin-like isoform X2 [Dreissena polymorpha]|uniref:stomatin-like isoform X2 n=1 Tax=Dreissena polymorpha TaxID=45954 RepID=UPI0022655AA6|nr:stomatin-like isoform X2 [Dreissena polymorpha]
MDSNDRGKEGRQEPEGELGCCGCVLMGVSIFILIIFFPFSLICSLKIVQEYERAVIFRLGRVLSGGAKGPGLFFLMPCVDTFRCVDMRTFSYDIPPQEILSRDSVTVAVDAVIYARIFDATLSIICIENAQSSTRLLAATTLRNVLGTKPLSEILTDRESIASQMQHTLDEGTHPWGVKIERVEMKDVRLPVQMQRAMAAEAEATRDARAKVILAEGEMKASRSLKEAADIMSQSPAAMQIRYLQTLHAISAENNSTIIFPLPIDMLSVATKKGGGGSNSRPAIQAPPIRKVEPLQPAIAEVKQEVSKAPMKTDVVFEKQSHATVERKWSETPDPAVYDEPEKETLLVSELTRSDLMAESPVPSLPGTPDETTAL